MADPVLRELSVVELQTASGRWPAGTPGTIVEIESSTVLVEVADDRGHLLDLVSLPLDAVATTGSLETGGS